MFDDQNQKNPQAPSNLPFGQPQSPFVSPPTMMQQPQPTYTQPAAQAPVNYSQPPVAQPQTAGRIDDMFAETDPLTGSRPASTGYPAAQFNPNQAPQAGLPNYYPAAGNPMADDLFGRRGFPWGKAITIFIIVVVVVGGVGASYWGYKYVTSGSTVKTTNTPVTTTPTNQVVTTNNQVATTTTDNITPVTSAPVTEEIKDSDGDGLTDQEEKALGTKIDVADTDADGLTDWAEIKIYKTDPLNSDTDGDTYKDGQEVINGYDPTKPGSARLYEVPKNGTTTK